MKRFREELRRVEAKGERQEVEVNGIIEDVGVVLKEREEQVGGLKGEIERLRNEGLGTKKELESTQAALREVTRELAEAKREPSRAVVASFLWLARLIEVMIDLTITHFVNRIFEATGMSMVILGLVLVCGTWWFT